MKVTQHINIGDIVGLLKDGFKVLDTMTDIEILDEWNKIFLEKNNE